MNKFKTNVKKALAGILSTAMILTSGVIPNTLTSVQAAEVYNDTTTALSSLAGSTGLKLYKLDGSETTLNNGIYYLESGLTYNADKSRKNGLTIGENQTVYMYIPEGVTLTVYGQDGTNATNGGNGTEGQFDAPSPATTNGITAKENPGKAKTTNGATGENGATGGGAAIYVPSTAKLVVLGNGSINANGGNGGNASDGGNGGATNYLYFTGLYAKGKNQITSGTENWTYSKESLKTNMNNTTGKGKADPYAWFVRRASVGTGGAGGGGAAGGGAGIGSNGADGKSGVSSANANTANANSYDKISATDTAKNSTSVNTAATSGTVYVSGVQMSCTGGNGGNAGNTATTEGTKTDSFKAWSSSSLNTFTVWYANGQAGGGGAAGGKGASIGIGGQGGAGGMAGDSGALITNCTNQSTKNSTSGLSSIPSAGKNGVAGSNGAESKQNLGENQYPYNTITFTNLTSANTKYYITKSGTFTAPDYSVGENQTFVGWKVTTPAVALPKAFGETADSTLTTKDNVIPAGTEVSTAGIYGNVTLEPVVVDHVHNWTYEADGNVVKAYCTETNHADKCDYQKGHELTLTLKAEKSMTYSGKAYTGASVKNNITDVTGAKASDITYYSGSTKLSSAPTNAGQYTAKVTIGGKTASADFTISKAAIKPSVTLGSWIYGGTAATPKVDGNTENAEVTYAYKTKDAADSTYKEAKVAELKNLPVGQYTLKATVEESANYKGGTATCDFNITRTPLENVSVTMTGWTYGSYDESKNTPVLGKDSNPGNGKVTYTYYTDKDCTTKTTAKDGAESDGAVPKNAGVYYVKASVAETDNYAAGEATASFVVKTKAITATVSAESKVYDGTTDAKVTATVETGVKGESFTISGLKGTFSDKNVGSSKTVTVDPSHANATAGENTVVTNYSVSYPKTAEADITPCPVELTWSETDLTYTGAEQSVTATVKNAAKGDSFNITYEGNTETEVNDNYTAKVTALGNDNYTLEKATGISQKWSIRYLEAGEAEVVGTKGNNDWYVSAVTLVPEEGYQISTDKKEWFDSLGCDAQGEQETTYYLREIKTGYITDAKTASFKIDTVAPTGEITIGTNTFKEFLNKVTFGHWFKDTVSVKIAGEDATSGIATVEYQKVGKNDKYDENGNWVEGKSLSITDKDKYVIYARLTDKAGKQTIINSDGIVVFTDSTAVEAISYTKTTKESVDAEVALNGNTVASVKNGEAVLVEGTDYTVSADKITFSGDYLDTLSAGTHTLTVSYNPQGETEYIDGDKPVESQITVNVSRQTASLEITDTLDKEYNGIPADVKYVTNSNAEVKVEYKVDGKWQTEAPIHVGSYEVKVSVPENGDYTAASDSKTFTISKTDARISTMTSGISTYGDAVDIKAGVSLVNGETYTGEIEYSYRLAGTDDEYTAGIPSKAGSYETKATVKAFGDYNGASAEGTWTIKQKEVTVSGITAKDKVYDGKAAAELDYSEVAFEGILANDTLTVSATGTFADSNVASEKSVMITDLTLGGKDAGNYVLAGAGQQTITTAAITPKEVSVEITPNGGTYEGTITGATADLSGAVAGENPEVVLTYTGTANDGTVVSGTEVPTHAGTYTVTATVPDTNYSLKAEGATAEFTVAKAAPQLSVSAVADKNYGEEAFKLETDNKGDGQKTFASDNDKVATVDENGAVTIVGAGKATLTVTLAETANYTADQKKVAITVKKIERKLTVTRTEYQVTYGDPAFKIAASADDTETPIRFTSSNPNVAKVSDDGTVTIGNVGTTKINVSMAESNNYLAISKEVTVKVIPKDVTVTPNDTSKVYGEKDGELTCKTEGLVGEDTLSDITLSRAEGEDVGSYDIAASEKKDANPNYNVKFEKGTFTITQRAVGLTWTDTKLTYNGKNQQPKAAATGLVEKDSCEVTVTGAQKDAGTYTATATGLSNPNYKLPKEVSAAYTIGAKEIAAVITANGGIYEGTITPATAVLNGLVGEDNPEITLTYAGTANDGTEVKGTEVPTHAGTYKVTATISDDNYSLKAEGQAAEFTVAKAASQLSVSAVADKNYGEEAFKLETSNKGDGQKTFASDNDKVATVDENGVVTIVGAGKVTLTVTLAESANYTADQKTVTITVKKIDHKLTVDKIAYEVTYGDPEFKIAASAEDSETAINFVSDNEDAAKVSADGTVTIGNVGTAKITVSMDESGNYLAVAKEVTVTVVPKKVTVIPDKISKVYGEKDGELTYKADGLVGEDTLTDITLSRAEGENVGNYTITAAQKDGANPNYEVVFNEGTFVIEPKNIETAEVTLGDALKYTGKEQTQEITKVLIDGIEVPADSYEVTGNTATDAGVHTLTITAKEGSNFTGTVTWTYVIAPTKPEQIKENADGKVEIGNGTLTIAVKSEGNAPKTSLVTDKAEIIDMLVKSGDITADELAQIANGASVDVVLTVKDASATISKEAKTAMKDTASKAGYTIGQYIDISLYKYMTVDGVTDEGVQLHSTADKIKIAVQIPENLINKDSKVERTYYMIRYHDGKAEIIEGTYNEKTQTFTFETDKFSDYAIAYKDVKKADAAGTSNGTGKSNTVKTNKTVKTGDTTNVFVYLIVLLGAFAVIVGVAASRRKRIK